VIDGVPVHRWLFLRPTFDHLVRGRADVFAASFYFHPASMLRLRRLLRQFEPDVVNIHFPESQISTVLWARRSFPFPLVASLHGDDVERWTSSESHHASDGGRRRLRSLLRAADAITTCSQYLREKAAEIEGATVRKSHVIPNGIAVERFEDLSSYTHPQSYILAYGRLVHKKGFDLLARAFAQVAPSYPDTDLILAGEGEARGPLEKLCAQEGIASRVHFYGRASQTEIVRLLNGCRLAVVPSRQEPFGIAALEAIAARKPLVATRVGGLPEVTRSAHVNLVEPTVAGLVAGILEKLASPAAGAGAQPASPRPTLPSWQDVAEQYLQIYSGLITPERLPALALSARTVN
jgi:glycosyltransferase involved in cell wall biosynthesis